MALTSQVAVAAAEVGLAGCVDAVAHTVHSPSYGSVTSYDHVAFVAPTTSGRTGTS